MTSGPDLPDREVLIERLSALAWAMSELHSRADRARDLLKTARVALTTGGDTRDISRDLAEAADILRPFGVLRDEGAS